jgi:uncharacterized damage-inducible protein DinB
VDTQPEPTLIEFARYNLWASQRLMAICADLDDASLATSIDGTPGSILDTFGHILRAEAGFPARIQGTAPQPPYEWEDGPDLDQMSAYAAKLGEALLATIQSVSPTENVHEEDGDWEFDYQARLIVMSLVFHGISHRTDISTFLNCRGVALPELDVWGCQAEHPERFQARLRQSGAS